MSYIVISFYTKDSPYEQEILNLKSSLENFNLAYYFQDYPPRGRWILNASIKSEFILSMLEKFYPLDILYLDADAIVRQYPKLFDNFSGDIGLHYRGGLELLSGTIYFKNNDKVKKIIHLWINAQKNNINEWDQRIFAKVIEEHAKNLDIKIINLPVSYTQIFSCHRARAVGEPVIEHFQASRRFRKVMGYP